MRETALMYLSRDFVLNIDMIEGIRRNMADVLYADEHCVLLKYKTFEHLAISADSAEIALKALEICGGIPDDIVVHQKAAAAAIKAKYRLRDFFLDSFYNCVFTKPVPEPIGDIRPVPMELAEYVDANYEHGDLEYIKDRIATGNLFGFFVDGELAGFVGEHNDGAMGLLEVLPKYRQRGLGSQLDHFNILRERGMGHVPFGQILSDNTLSIQMHEHMGAVLSDTLLSWLVRE